MLQTTTRRSIEDPQVLHRKSVRVVVDRGPMKAPAVLIDAHVHSHRCFDPAALLDHACENFSLARNEMALSHTAPGCLLLAENPGDNFFEQLKNTVRVGAWHVHSTAEPGALLLRRPTSCGVDTLAVIAGKQIVVREGLEVLTLCCGRSFPAGRSLKSTLEEAIRAGAIPVLPWGFGKWWFRRGSLVRKVLDSGFSSCIWLGDNGNRMEHGPRPRLFLAAQERGIGVLPGSDPFPMQGRERDVARCGFILRGDVDLDRPATWIKAALLEQRDRREPIVTFGRCENIARFCASQIAMQLRRLHHQHAALQHAVQRS